MLNLNYVQHNISVPTNILNYFLFECIFHRV
jgi:hypothetical protein